MAEILGEEYLIVTRWNTRHYATTRRDFFALVVCAPEILVRTDDQVLNDRGSRGRAGPLEVVRQGDFGYFPVRAYPAHLGEGPEPDRAIGTGNDGLRTAAGRNRDGRQLGRRGFL